MFAIYDNQTNSPSYSTIFATGETESDAWAVLQQWGVLEGTGDAADYAPGCETWSCVPCSEAVHRSDGQTAWTMCADGIARLDSEFVSPEDFCDAHEFTADNYPEEDCDAANAELLRLASDPANIHYLLVDSNGCYVRDGRDLCDRANNNI